MQPANCCWSVLEVLIRVPVWVCPTLYLAPRGTTAHSEDLGQRVTLHDFWCRLAGSRHQLANRGARWISELRLLQVDLCLPGLTKEGRIQMMDAGLVPLFFAKMMSVSVWPDQREGAPCIRLLCFSNLMFLVNTKHTEYYCWGFYLCLPVACFYDHTNVLVNIKDLEYYCWVRRLYSAAAFFSYNVFGY